MVMELFGEPDVNELYKTYPTLKAKSLSLLNSTLGLPPGGDIVKHWNESPTEQKIKWLRLIFHGLTELQKDLDKAAEAIERAKNTETGEKNTEGIAAQYHIEHEDCSRFLDQFITDKTSYGRGYPALVLTDPPFNVLRGPDGKLLAQDTLTERERTRFVNRLTQKCKADYTVLLLFCDVREYGLWAKCVAFYVRRSVDPLTCVVLVR